MIGQEVFGYQIEKLIGKGSFASVYKVKKENESGTYVRALKHIVIPEQSQYQRVWNAMGRDKEKTDHYFEQIFHETMQEIRLLHAFTDSGIHNIVSCYENDVVFHESPRRYEIFILMEYLTPLSDYLGKNDLTTADVLDMGIQILNALEVCHNNHIIHRDVKEDNIFLSSNGVYKLGDFGVAKVLANNGPIFSLKGTTGYMAPEVLRNAEVYDETVDLYSLGMVLYRLMNHMRSPFFPAYPNGFDAGDEERALRRRMNGEVLPMPDAASASFGKIILKALAPRNQRFQSVEDFRKALVREKELLNQWELQQSVMCEKHIIHEENTKSESFRDEPQKKDVSRRVRLRKLILTAIVIIAMCGTICSAWQHKKMKDCVEQWEHNSIFPFAAITMDMTKEDFKEYYGARLSQGNENQYYLELRGEHTKDYVTIIFQGKTLISVSYRFVTDEQYYLKLCKGFYKDWSTEQDKWPYIINTDSAQVILDYDDSKSQAYLLINRTKE